MPPYRTRGETRATLSCRSETPTTSCKVNGAAGIASFRRENTDMLGMTKVEASW